MTKKKKNQSGYFIIDGAQVDQIAEEYGLEEMAAYLSLAVSTDESNTATVGGINSIMRYSGLSRGEAKKKQLKTLINPVLWKCLTLNERGREPQRDTICQPTTTAHT